MRRISNLQDIEIGLEALCVIDPRLIAVRSRAGEIALRRTEPGFASLVAIIVSQQVSRASANAILRRLTQLAAPLTPVTLLEADDAFFRHAGLSRPKQKTLIAVSEAVRSGLDLATLCEAEADVALDAMTAVPGIGRWTAEVYLLTAAGHPDIFPAGDLALQSAVGHALAFSSRPGEKALRALAREWAPHRGVASRLFWAYYREIKGWEGAPSS